MPDDLSGSNQYLAPLHHWLIIIRLYVDATIEFNYILIHTSVKRAHSRNSGPLSLIEGPLTPLKPLGKPILVWSSFQPVPPPRGYSPCPSLPLPLISSRFFVPSQRKCPQSLIFDEHNYHNIQFNSSSTSTITITSNSTPLHIFPSSNSSPDNTSSAPPPPTSPIGGRCHSVAFTQPSFFFHCPGALSSTTSRVICGLEPISQPLNIAINGIAADLRAVAIEISQRRSFQDRYASDLQAVLDAGESLHKRTRKVSFVPPPMYEDATIPISPTRSFPQRSAQPTILAPSSPAIEFKNIVVNEVLSAAYHKLASVLPPPPSMSPSPSSCSPPPPPPVTDPSSLYSLIRLVLPQTFHM
ncbi:hypothetical protein JOM56_015728 [Amanita muscaria]